MPRKPKKGAPRGTDDQKELGILIKFFRERMGLTQQGLSKRMGGDISDQLISRYENGGDHMRVGTYFKFVEAFGITPNQFCPIRLLAHLGSLPTDYPSLPLERRIMVDEIIRSFLNNPDASLEENAEHASESRVNQAQG